MARNMMHAFHTVYGHPILLVNRFVLLDACRVRPYHGIGQVHPGSFRVPSLASRDGFLLHGLLQGEHITSESGALFLRFLSIFSTALRKKEGCLS